MPFNDETESALSRPPRPLPVDSQAAHLGTSLFERPTRFQLSDQIQARAVAAQHVEAGEAMWAIMFGTKTSTGQPAFEPSKPDGPTPMIVNETHSV